VLVLGIAFALAFVAWARPAGAAMPQGWCNFPSWCPWADWSLCWAYSDCNNGGDTSGGTGDSSKPDPCQQCMHKCDAEYQQNVKRCGRSLACKNLALSELHACQGNCLTDFCS
jgi:hypothetical protein